MHLLRASFLFFPTLFALITPVVAETGLDQFFFITGGDSNIYTWTRDTESANQNAPEAYVTVEDNEISSLTCSFWRADDNSTEQFFAAKTLSSHWSIQKTTGDGVTSLVTEQSIGINGITQLAYDPHSNYLYFVNHYSSHWNVEVMNLESSLRTEIISSIGTQNKECVALHVQKQTLFMADSDNTLYYAALSGSNHKQVSNIPSGKTITDITGQDDEIYIAYSDSIEKRVFVNDDWTEVSGSMLSFSPESVKSVFATDTSLYVALTSGQVKRVDLETWTPSDFADFSAPGIDEFCVSTYSTDDPSGFKSACAGNSPCDDFCFDTSGVPTCYCAHNGQTVAINVQCPDVPFHLATSHELWLAGIAGNGFSGISNFEQQFSSANADSSINDISYNSDDKTIYVALDNQIIPVQESDGLNKEAEVLDSKVLRVRVDAPENRVYVASDNGDIEYYRFKSGTDKIKDTRHLVISRIHASDFVVDFCYKNLYIASQNPDKIVKSSLMGGNFETILSGPSVGKIDSLAIDRTNRILYFSDSVKQIIGKLNVTDPSQPLEVVHEFDSSFAINTMELHADLLYFYNSVEMAVQMVDLKYPGSLANVKVYKNEQEQFRLVSLIAEQCPVEFNPCEVNNGGCMDKCTVYRSRALCSCEHDNQYLISSIPGFCDWSNKTQYCQQGLSGDEDTHISCEFAQKCIYARSVCDGIQDCVDGADEDLNVCSNKTCKDDEFKCHNGRCIASELECDHTDNCRDGSDEIYCDYKDIECSESEFRCVGNHKCIPSAQVCDGTDQCLDGMASDESINEPASCDPADCSQERAWYGWIGLEFYECPDTHLCIPMAWRCDAHAGDCGTDSDEAGCGDHDCGEDNFKCDNGFCVYVKSWLCDNYNDCGDYSDEQNCHANDTVCDESEFKCNNGNCVPKAYRCDGDNDCHDNSDETLDCENLECEDNQFKCSVNPRSRNRCIPKSSVCDQEADCEDGEDELQDCPVPDPCDDDEFTCGNSLCVPESWYCDGENDCGDGSDEPVGQQCNPEDCGSYQFRCANGRCIANEQVCDRMNNCMDQSDEQDCEEEEDERCDLETEFECAGSLRSKCIDKELVCDGHSNCDHGTDELYCDINECESEDLHNCEQICIDEKSLYRCECWPGYELDQATGYACNDIDECSLFPRFCTQLCENREGSALCKCVDGYAIAEDSNGNLTICKHLAGDVLLLYTDELAVRSYNLETGEAKYVENEGDLIVAADFDFESQTVFYVDITKEKIMSVKMDGSDMRVLIGRDVRGAEGLAVDWIAKNIYWVDRIHKTVEVATQDAKYRNVLMSKGLKNPRAIVVHPKRKMLFYSDWGSGNEHIGRMYMDGASHSRIVTSVISWPNGLTLDYATDTLYWVDAHLQRLESVDLDGSNRFLIASGTNTVNMAHPFAVSVFGQFVFWTDWNTKTVNRADKRDGSGSTVVRDSSKRPMDIHVYHHLRQLKDVTNAAGDMMVTYEESNCLIMLLTQNGGSDFVCGCSAHFIRDPDTNECVQNCPSGYKVCNDSSACYPDERFCDKVVDCADQSDEPESCPPNPCLPGQLHCVHSDKCVEHYQICDGKFQCGDSNSPDEEKRNDQTDEADCHVHECPAGYRKCTNNVCIPESFFCDGTDDCGDNSDEVKENCPGCDEMHEFQCHSGRCIPLTYRCDFDEDCDDGEDEPPTCQRENANCGRDDGKFPCETNYRCIPSYKLCDGTDDCRDNSDEKNCGSHECDTGQFQCDNNKCIPQRYKCDFVIHCTDGSDESEELCQDAYRPCDEDLEFACTNKKCIPKSDACDQYNDCGDNSDENVDYCKMIHACRSDQFPCTTSGHCIPLDWRCLDGEADCPDKSDEMGCGARYPGGRFCKEDQFTCANTVCISEADKCNGFDDCGDGSDELHSDQEGCNHQNCNNPSLFHCSSGECIYEFHVCSGQSECFDGSDESARLCESQSHTCSGDSSLLRCHSHNQCYSEEQACDGVSDCDDHTDEIGCHSDPCSVDNGGCEHVCKSTTSSGEQVNFCLCHHGYTHAEDDPKSCDDIDECLLWDTCSQENCANTKGSFDCQCEDNYKLSVDKKVCKAMNDPMMLFYLKGDNLMRLIETPALQLDVETVENLAGNPVSFDYFYGNSTLYWLDESANKIHRSIIPHFDVRESVQFTDQLKLSRKPSKAIAIDWIHNLLYWFEEESSAYKLVVSTVDGRYPKTLTENVFHDPRDLTVDPIRASVYITNFDSNDGMSKIQKFAAGQITTLVQNSIGDPQGIAVDYFKDGRVYWADFSQQAVHCVLPNGDDKKTIAFFDADQKKLKPHSLFVFEHEVYFSAQNSQTGQGGLFKRSKFTDDPMDEVLVIKSDISVRSPMTLFQDHARPRSVEFDHCKNSGCSHLCLPEAAQDDTPVHQQHICACPDGIDFNRGSITSCATAMSEYQTYEGCNGNGYLDRSLLCQCYNGFTGDACQSAVKSSGGGAGKVVGGIVVVMIVALVSLVAFLGFVFRHQIKREFSRRTAGTTAPVNFHVGGRANPGFDTHDNDRVTLGQDFHGVVEEGPVDANGTAGPGLSIPTNTGGSAFRNPVYEINEAQNAIRDFKPPQIESASSLQPAGGVSPAETKFEANPSFEGYNDNSL